jgi:signal transduction histidine kinase
MMETPEIQDVEAAVLLVDDSMDNLDMMSRMLGRLDVHVEMAQSGREALTIAADREFAVILMDVQMPVLSGIDTAAVLRENEPHQHTPIIFITAHAAEDRLIRQAYRLGAVDFVTKPMNFNILRSKVSFFVDFFRKNKMVQLQAEQLLEKERRERKLEQERKVLEEHGEALARLVKELQQANEALDSFASIVSHDLQEPLRGIMALSQILQERTNNRMERQEQELLDTIVSESERMQLMILDLLTLARLGTDDSLDVPVDVNVSLQTALANLQHAIDIAQPVITHDPLPTVMCHPAQMVQLLQNLIGNAIKFRTDKQPTVHIAVEEFPDQWQFRVSDNGIGIAEKHQSRIFAPFRRLHTRQKYPGTGVGLAICQKIVEKRHCEIRVESSPGNGAAFVFSLPKVPPLS